MELDEDDGGFKKGWMRRIELPTTCPFMLDYPKGSCEGSFRCDLKAVPDFESA
jgi:hypothetical protein